MNDAVKQISEGPEAAPTHTPFSTAVLVAANLLPLVAAIWLGWDAGSIVLLYWIENLVAGGFNVVRMAAATAPLAQKLALIPFFIVHYGAFCFGHGTFVAAMFPIAGVPDYMKHSVAGLFLSVVREPGLLGCVAAIVISHGVSLAQKYFAAGDYRTANLQQLMFRPYARIVALHITIIFGGFLMAAGGGSIGVLAVLVGMKLAMEFGALRRWS